MTEDIYAEKHVFTFWVSTVSTWSPLGNLVQGRQIRDFSYNSTSSSTSITPATLTSSSASGRSAFFETWEATEQRDYSYTSTPYLLAFKSRTDYPVQGSKSRVFSALLKRASTFSLWRTQEIQVTSRWLWHVNKRRPASLTGALPWERTVTYSLLLLQRC